MKQKKLVSMIGALGLMLSAVLAVSGCRHSTGNETTVTKQATKVEGGAMLIVNPDKKDIDLIVETTDGSDVTVEGCDITELNDGFSGTLHATGDTIVIKGNIKSLTCSENKLTSLNVQGLPDLETLVCSKNQLTSLDLHGLTKLSMLDCTENKLSSLNLQGATALTMVSCQNNELTTLDVQGLTSVTTLYCSYNKLKDLDIAGLAALQNLSCESNQLEQNVKNLLAALPDRSSTSGGLLILYTEKTGDIEGNGKPSSAELAPITAKNWTVMKIDADGSNQSL